MSDPRNVAHKKKVTQEKHHQEAKPAVKSSTGKKSSEMENQTAEPVAPATNTGAAKGESHSGDLEKSLAVLSKLKEMEFHSRANIETLAQLSLTVEEELKQREFAETISTIYSAQDAFHSKIAAFIATYEAKCENLKPA
jgi:molecular chaperone GrpE (heat shock protein)